MKVAAARAHSVQLVAVRSPEAAERAWSALSRENSDLIGPLSPRVVRADLGAKGVVYRLQAGPFANEGEARRLCAALEARGQSCFIVVN